jgi:hypothetical protein
MKSFRWFPTLQTLTSWLSWLNVAGTLQIKKVGIYDAGALANAGEGKGYRLLSIILS